MAVDKRIELELVLRDTVSLTLKAVADNLDKINKSLAKGKEEKVEGADAFTKIKETTEGIRKTTEEGAQQITAHGERMLPLITKLSSPVTRGFVQAAAAGFITQAIADQMKQRMAIRDMAIDANFPEDFVDMLQQAQVRLGIQSGKADENIRRFGRTLADTAYGKGGVLTKELDKIGEGKLATTIENLVGVGRSKDAAMAALNRFAELTKSSDAEDQTKALRLADAFKLPPSFFKNLSDELKLVVPRFKGSLEEAKVFYNSSIDFWTWMENATKRLKGAGVVILNRTFDVIGSIGSLWTNSLAANPTVRSTLGLPPLTAAELEDYKKRNETTLRLIQEILLSLQSAQNKESIEKREEGGTVLAGRTYEVAEKGPEVFRSNTGIEQVLFPRNQGPRFFKPKTGGDILPNIPDPFAGDDWRKRMPLPGPDDPGSFGQRFGQWPGYRWTEEGYMEHPRAPRGGTAEENWEALNKGLTGEFGAGVGTSEGETQFSLDPEKGTIFDLRMNQMQMEQREKDWSGALEESMDLSQRRGAGPPLSEEDIYYGDMEAFEPASFRSMIDSELGGGGGGSLGAEVIFKNVPPGVETSAEGDGFDNFTVNKTRQLAGA